MKKTLESKPKRQISGSKDPDKDNCERKKTLLTRKPLQQRRSSHSKHQKKKINKKDKEIKEEFITACQQQEQLREQQQLNFYKEQQATLTKLQYERLLKQHQYVFYRRQNFQQHLQNLLKHRETTPCPFDSQDEPLSLVDQSALNDILFQYQTIQQSDQENDSPRSSQTDKLRLITSKIRVLRRALQVQSLFNQVMGRRPNLARLYSLRFDSAQFEKVQSLIRRNLIRLDDYLQARNKILASLDLPLITQKNLPQISKLLFKSPELKSKYDITRIITISNELELFVLFAPVSFARTTPIKIEGWPIRFQLPKQVCYRPSVVFCIRGLNMNYSVKRARPTHSQFSFRFYQVMKIYNSNSHFKFRLTQASVPSRYRQIFLEERSMVHLQLNPQRLPLIVENQTWHVPEFTLKSNVASFEAALVKGVSQGYSTHQPYSSVFIKLLNTQQAMVLVQRKGQKAELIISSRGVLESGSQTEAQPWQQFVIRLQETRPLICPFEANLTKKSQLEDKVLEEVVNNIQQIAHQPLRLPQLSASH